MGRNIVIKADQNPEKNFYRLRQDLLRIASDRGVEVTEVIDEFMEDLQNLGNSDYVIKANEFKISGSISQKTLNSLKSYLIRLRKNFKDIENKEKKKEKSNGTEEKWRKIEETIDEIEKNGRSTKKEIVQEIIAAIKLGNFEYEFDNKEKKTILKRLKGIIDEIDRQEEEKRRKQQEELERKEMQKRSVEKAMTLIQEIVDRECKKGNVKNKASYLCVIRDGITGKDKNINLGINMDEETEEKLLKLIDDRIELEKNEIYFEQVKRFTRGFQFLKEYPEIVNATRGNSKLYKFTDSESYSRFCNLRKLLQKEYNEQIGIQLLIESDEVDDTDIRILLARKEVMDKEIERKRKNGEIR